MSDRMGSSRAPPSPLSPGASPSSKVSKQPEKPPLPKAFVAALCLCSCAHGYIMTNLFSYAGLMCADLGWVEDRDSAGFIAGFLSSANMIGRTFTAGAWAIFAERHGYKRGMVVSMVCVALTGMLFGFCTDLVPAVLVRLIVLGCGNGYVLLMGPISVEVAVVYVELSSRRRGMFQRDGSCRR